MRSIIGNRECLIRVIEDLEKAEEIEEQLRDDDVERTDIIETLQDDESDNPSEIELLLDLHDTLEKTLEDWETFRKRLYDDNGFGLTNGEEKILQNFAVNLNALEKQVESAMSTL